MIYPEHLLFLNEVGLNLNYDSNKNVRGEKYIFSAGSSYITIISNNIECYYIVYRFVSIGRKPVISIVIIKAERLNYEQIIGININIPHIEY